MNKKPLFYFVNWSVNSKKAKILIESSNLEIQMIDLSDMGTLGVFAESFFRYGGPSKAPALIVPEDKRCYEGLSQIKQYLEHL